MNFVDNLQEQKARLLSDIAVYEKRLQTIQKVFGSFTWIRVKGLISESDYCGKCLKILPQTATVWSVLLLTVKSSLAEIEEKIAAGDNRRELIEQYTNLEHLTREIVETLIDYISVGKRIPGTRDVPIEIHWNF